MCGIKPLKINYTPVEDLKPGDRVQLVELPPYKKGDKFTTDVSLGIFGIVLHGTKQLISWDNGWMTYTTATDLKVLKICQD